MYEWNPKSANTTARKLILLFFIGAGALMLVTMLFPSVPFRWVFQLIALGLLSAAIFFVTRYVTKSFLYRIETTADGSADLTVTEISSGGKRRITVCRIGLDHILTRELLDNPAKTSERLASLKKEKIKYYDYTVEYQSAESILLIVNEGGEEIALRLSFDADLFALLRPKKEDNTESPS